MSRFPTAGQPCYDEDGITACHLERRGLQDIVVAVVFGERPAVDDPRKATQASGWSHVLVPSIMCLVDPTLLLDGSPQENQLWPAQETFSPLDRFHVLPARRPSHLVRTSAP